MEIVLFLAPLAMPLIAGFVLARVRPGMGALLASLLAALPLMAVFAAVVLHFGTALQRAPLEIAAVLVFGTVAALCGFGLGMVGHMLGSRRGTGE